METPCLPHHGGLKTAMLSQQAARAVAAQAEDVTDVGKSYGVSVRAVMAPGTQARQARRSDVVGNRRRGGNVPSWWAVAGRHGR